MTRVVNTYGVTHTDLDLPYGMRVFADDAGGGGLTVSKVQDFIVRGAGQLGSILIGKGIDPDTLDDLAVETMRAGIIAYATGQCLKLAPGNETLAQRAWEEFGSVRKTLRETPGDLGEAEDKAQTIHTNVPKGLGNRRKWSGDGKQGW